MVALSFSSSPAIADKRIAASITVLAIGPAVSHGNEMGMIPLRLTNPTVGFIPTNPLIDAGLTIEPSVSVPTATAQRFEATAVPDPELDPDGFLSR